MKYKLGIRNYELGIDRLFINFKNFTNFTNQRYDLP